MDHAARSHAPPGREVGSGSGGGGAGVGRAPVRVKREPSRTAGAGAGAGAGSGASGGHSGAGGGTSGGGGGGTGSGSGGGGGSGTGGGRGAAYAPRRGVKRQATSQDSTLQEMTVRPLGAGAEVGRSCHVLKYKGKTIMFDCGVHPGNAGLNALPFLDEVDPATIDILFISHFHLDHAASVPYLTERTDFKGRVFATHPTKAVMKVMLSDYMRVASIAGEDTRLYTDKELNASIDRIETADFHQTLTVSGIKFQFFNAGHVLGAAMVLVEIAGVRVLYTGDYSCEEDRHLMSAKPPTEYPPHVLIVEATYGVKKHEPREVREKLFTSQVESIVLRGGRCLIPVFALGRAQEILLILEEHWEANPRLVDVPIYFSSKLANESLKIFQTYLSHMNTHIQASDRNPFHFRHVSSLRSMNSFEDVGPCVVLASPGMLQSGLSRQLFERWCRFQRNGVVLAGYAVSGTLAKQLLDNPDEVTSMDGRPLQVKCSIEYISFSAHADFAQTSDFVDALAPPNVILVHGEEGEMRRLYGALGKAHRHRPGFQIFMPKNNEVVRLEFREERRAKAIGRVAAKGVVAGAKVAGIIVQRDFQFQILDPSDIEAYTDLSTHTVKQTQHIPFRQSFDVLKTFIQSLYEEVTDVKGGEHGMRCLLVCGVVTVSHRAPDRVVLSWLASPGSDMIADSVASVVLQADHGIAGARAVYTPHSHGGAGAGAGAGAGGGKVPPADAAMADRAEEISVKVMKKALSEHFESVELNLAEKIFTVTHGGHVAVVKHETTELECDDVALEERIKAVLRRAQTALYPVYT